jgi:hypothetical protein
VTATLRLRSDDLEWREVEGEVVALDLRSATYIAINQTGARLWSTLAFGATRDELVDLLVEEYAIPRTQAQSDADAFVEMLDQQDMLIQG